jgi:site-specific DNA-methyltransferase (adenine-specific)
MPDAMAVIAAWGFTYKTCAFLWAKENPGGFGFHMGLGSWSRANTEPCLLATRGHPKRIRADVRQLLISPRGRHSAKPPEVRKRIVQLMGDLPRVELFAREKADGWDAWGNEVECDLELEVPHARP